MPPWVCTVLYVHRMYTVIWEKGGTMRRKEASFSLKKEGQRGAFYPPSLRERDNEARSILFPLGEGTMRRVLSPFLWERGNNEAHSTLPTMVLGLPTTLVCTPSHLPGTPCTTPGHPEVYRQPRPGQAYRARAASCRTEH